MPSGEGLFPPKKVGQPARALGLLGNPSPKLDWDKAFVLLKHLFLQAVKELTTHISGIWSSCHTLKASRFCEGCQGKHGIYKACTCRLQPTMLKHGTRMQVIASLWPSRKGNNASKASPTTQSCPHRANKGVCIKIHCEQRRSPPLFVLQEDHSPRIPPTNSQTALASCCTGDASLGDDFSKL